MPYKEEVRKTIDDVLGVDGWQFESMNNKKVNTMLRRLERKDGLYSILTKGSVFFIALGTIDFIQNIFTGKSVFQYILPYIGRVHAVIIDASWLIPGITFRRLANKYRYGTSDRVERGKIIMQRYMQRIGILSYLYHQGVRCKIMENIGYEKLEKW